MPVRLNGSTSGYVELAAPAVAGSTSLTLPLTGFGKVLQVQSATTTSAFSTSSTTYTDYTGLSLSITPASTSSKIVLLATMHAYNSGTATYVGEFVNLVRGSTQIAEQVVSAPGSVNKATAISIAFVDSPSTTSSTTYKVQVKTETNGKFDGLSGYAQTLLAVEFLP